MAPTQYTRLILSERPKQLVNEKTFRKETLPFDLKPGRHEAVVKIIYISIDPTMRLWMNDTRSYFPPVQIGEVMRALAVGVVTVSGPDSRFKKGDYVSGALGLQEYAIVHDDGDFANKVELVPGAKLIDYLGPLGLTAGITAYVGLFDTANIKPGETIVVSAAGGAAGSLVCQFAKRVGARVVGIVGSDEKLQWLEEIGVDFAFNYKHPSWKDDFIQKVGYVDVYLDNVGGPVSSFIYTRMRTYGRVAVCGAISEYNAEDSAGLKNYSEIFAQRLTVKGFIVIDHTSEFPMIITAIAQWLADGSIKRRYHVLDGLDHAVEAINRLFTGDHKGKLILAIANPDEEI